MRPRVKAKNSEGKVVEKNSQLFDDLMEITQDRKSTLFLYGLSKTEKAKALQGLKYDSMGEVTATSLIDSLNLNSVTEDLKTIARIEKELRLNEDGKPRVMDIFSAVEIMDRFNGTNKNYIVMPVKTEGGYSLKVVPSSGENLQQAKSISFNSELNNQLLGIMRSLGFDIQVVDSEDFGGLFDPTTARFSKGFIQIIKIAKGEIGEQALPEEFSHLMIEGLKTHPLVTRLLATIDDSIARQVLGEQYEQYAREYKNDFSKIAKEVAGRMLADKIINGGTMTPTKVRGNLLQRAWNFAKGLFSKTKESDVKNAREEADRLVNQIYEGVKDRTIVKFFDKKNLINGDKLYNLRVEFNNLRDMAFQAQKITAKKINIMQIREGRSRLSKEDKEVLQKLEQQYQDEKYLESIEFFLNDALKVMTELNRDFTELRRKEDLRETADLDVLREAAKLLRRIEEFSLGYGDIISAYTRVNRESTLDRINNNSEGQKLPGRIARKLADIAFQTHQLIEDMKEDHAKISKDVVYAYMRTIFGEDKIVGLSSDSEEHQAMILSEILDHASRDINWIDRLFSSMADMDDPLLTLIKTGVEKKKEERDREFIKIATILQTAEKELKEAGYTSDFILERNSQGIPTGFIISQYDFKTYNEEFRKMVDALRAQGKKGSALTEAIKAWKYGPVEVVVNGRVETHSRLIPLFYDENNKDKEQGKYMEVPNPLIFSNNANKINSLPKAQREYYELMIELKKQAMLMVPTKGYSLYKAIYISKTGMDGILAHTGGDPAGIARAVLQNLKSNFVRRADEIDVDRINENKEEIIDDLIMKMIITPIVDKDKLADVKDKVTDLLLKTDSTEKLEERLPQILKDAGVRDTKVKRAVQQIIGVIDEYMSDNYDVDTDFADHVIQKLPTNYMRKLKDMRDMSTDFTGAMQAFYGMALNYAKLNEIIDLMEVTRSYIKYQRPVNIVESGKPVTWNWRTITQHYKENLAILGAESNIGAVIDNYFQSALYGKRKARETMNVAGMNIDYGRITDSLRDYSGTLGLGLNIFCALSNIAVGKIQQWIEAYAGEYFTYKDYAKAQVQYFSMLPSYLAELSSPIKKSKLGLLMQRYDPAGEMFSDLTKRKHYSNALMSIIGNGEFFHIGMSGGEHMLRCTTMLARLNNIKLRIDGENGKEISLLEALETKTENGITSLALKPNLWYQVPEMEVDKKRSKNGNTVYKYVMEKDPKHPRRQRRKMKWVQYTDERDSQTKRALKKVNDLLNGSFTDDDAGTIQRWWWGRLVMQFRRWMPKHYERRFARAHWDDDLQERVEGYYNTLGKFSLNLMKDLRRAKLKIGENWNQLTPHERANLRRCIAEVGLFTILSNLCRFLGGRIKLKDDNWMEKMILYQLLRMKFEIGASMPSPYFINNVTQLLNSPMATINTIDAITDLWSFGDMGVELQSGPYKGMSLYTKHLIKATPGVNKIMQAYVFSEGMFSYLTDD